MPVCKEEPVKEVLIATNNAHKVEEIRTALNFEGWTFTTLAEAGVTSDPAEDADSFEGNARIKARAARAAARESLGRFVAVLADDSGLEVDALDGAPGVGISSVQVGENGMLTVTLSNGESVEAGAVFSAQEGKTVRTVSYITAAAAALAFLWLAVLTTLFAKSRRTAVHR